MGQLQVGIVGFDITPGIHPTCGAWGTTPRMTEVDMPLLSRCIALQQDDRRLLWYGSDLIGETTPITDALRDEVAEGIGLTRDQVIWSTSQTHSSGALPGSTRTGSSIADLSRQDPPFMAAQRRRFMSAFIEAGREALSRLRPARVRAGRGYCDDISYNTRFPMPDGGVKFSRHHAEGLQSGKAYDTTIGLVCFDDERGNVLGGIFNFCSHPATMINARWVSPDWVGSARRCIEDALGGAPMMFCQGMCGDVNCHHIFGTPAQARRTGTRLGLAAVEALGTLIPARAEPLAWTHGFVELPCRPMHTRDELAFELAARQAFIDELAHDPAATWFRGVNISEHLTVDEKIAFVGCQTAYLREGLRILDAGETPPSSLMFPVGAVRIGDVGAFLSAGENFTATGMAIRARSPFLHTLVCGDTNSLFGYIGDDAEIDRGGYETDSYWKMLYPSGFRLAPEKGTVQRIIGRACEMLEGLARSR